MTQQASEPDPNAATASGQQNPPANPSTERRPDDLFAEIDNLKTTVAGMPDAIIEALKQHGGVTQQQEQAARRAAGQESQGAAGQSAATPTDQTTGRSEAEGQSALAKWWFGK